MPDRNGFQVRSQGDREILGTREFDAPRELVWDAFTRPELVRRWMLGPDGWEMEVCELDLRVGGAYRYVWHQVGTGYRMGVSGIYLEVDRPRKLVNTEKFDPTWYPGEMVGTVEFAEKGRKTFMTQTLRYDSRETRDMVLKSPMESGMVATYDRLDSFLATLHPVPRSA